MIEEPQQSLLSWAADVTSLIGFLLAIATLVAARRAKSSADDAAAAASRAASDTKLRLLRVDSVAALSGVLGDLAAVEERHRNGQWDSALEKYRSTQLSLIEVRTDNPTLETADRRVLQTAIAQFKMMGEQVERAMKTDEGPDSSSLNETVATQRNALVELLTRLKRRDSRNV
ncbi:MAG: hypothetical protein AMXMBFR57_17660 [Acidimicrobiia bacterium]